MSDANSLRIQYLEAVRLHIWYSPSKFSYAGNKSSKELAARFRNLAHELYREYLLVRRGRS